MATTDLGKWMITNGGEYNPDTTYEQLTMVLYQNSTYITLRTVTGIIPNNDKINYILMAQGFSANALADVVAKDTYGVIGDVSGDVSAQNLVDYLTNEVVNNLLKKTSISTVQTNSDNTVPSSSLAYAMQQEITKNKEDIATANSNLAITITDLILPSWVTGNGINAVYKFGKVGLLSLRVGFNGLVSIGTTDFILASIPSNMKLNNWIATSAVTAKGIAVQLLCNPAQPQLKMSYNVADIQSGDEIIIQIPVIFG